MLILLMYETPKGIVNLGISLYPERLDPKEQISCQVKKSNYTFEGIDSYFTSSYSFYSYFTLGVCNKQRFALRKILTSYEEESTKHLIMSVNNSKGREVNNLGFEGAIYFDNHIGVIEKGWIRIIKNELRVYKASLELLIHNDQIGRAVFKCGQLEAYRQSMINMR